MEETRSLSKIIKSSSLNEKDKKVIVRKITPTSHIIEEASIEKEDMLEDKEVVEEKKQLLKDAEETANKIIASANARAAELLENEKIQIDAWWDEKRSEDAQIIEEAKQKGYQEGYESGKAEAEQAMEQKYSDTILEAKQLLEESYEIKNQLIQEANWKIIELSLSIAEKIVHKELEKDSELIQTMVKQALQHTKEYKKISIHVGPTYFSVLQQAREELMVELSGQVELVIFPDPSIKNGGCIIKTSYGTLDAKVDTQLEELKMILFDIVGRR